MIPIIGHLLQGVVIGLANLIPGVSGGTMALIMGIYERLVGATSDGTKAALSLVRFDWTSFWKGLQQLPWVFLAPLAIGLIITPFLGAGILEGWLEEYPVGMRALFLGLIIGSLPVPWMSIRQRSAGIFALMVLGATLAYAFSGLSAGAVSDPSLLRIFVSAAFAMSAMVLPGVSGSFLLLVLGLYEPTLRALDSLDLTFLAAFGAGAVVGLGAFAVLLNWLLKRFHDATMAVLFGLMLGSLRALWPYGSINEVSGSSLGLLLLGLVLTGALTFWEIRRRPSVDAGR